MTAMIVSEATYPIGSDAVDVFVHFAVKAGLDWHITQKRSFFGTKSYITLRADDAESATKLTRFVTELERLSR